jgi:hypothetical protein
MRYYAFNYVEYVGGGGNRKNLPLLGWSHELYWAFDDISLKKRRAWFLISIDVPPNLQSHLHIFFLNTEYRIENTETHVHKISTFLGPNGARLPRDFGTKKVSIFRAHPIQWPL